MRIPPRTLLLLVVTVAAASEAAAAGTLVVKYRDAVSACAETTFLQGRAFASVAPAGQLDALHARLKVTEIRAVFVSCAGLTAREATARWRARMERAVGRNQQRAARVGFRLPADVPDLSRVFRVRYAEDLPEEEAAVLYEADPTVEYARPDYPQQIEYIPDDPYFSSRGSWGTPWGPLDDLWNLKVIHAQEAWDLTMGEGMVIAVVDTGVDRHHPDLADNIWSNPGEIARNGIDDDGNGFVDDDWGWDFIGGDNNPSDSHGHGTHVAGIAAAVGDNALGILGVAPRAKVMSVRIFSGLQPSSGGAEAIVYAAESGADVINNSWGGRGVPGAGGALDDAVDTAQALGAVVVFAGSNGSFEISSVPWWRSPKAISVARAYPLDGAYSFSASDVDISAPGEEVLSLKGGNGMNGPTVDEDYVVGAGTSMATPHVSGAAALLLSALPTLTPAEVKWHLEAAAVQHGRTAWEGIPWNPMSGWGLLDLTRAFDPLDVTTRLDRYTLFERHAFVGRISDPSRIRHTFTTNDTVDWSANAPAWLQVAPLAGAGDGAVDLTIDARAASVGVYEGSYQLSAPGAADGGAALPARLYAYPDSGLADRTVVLEEDRQGVSMNFGLSGMAAAGSPTRSVLAWTSLQDVDARAAVLDRKGELVASHELSSGYYGQYSTAAFDGRRFAVVWIEYGERSKRRLVISRLAADGTLIDTRPRELQASSQWWMEPRIAYDGQGYVILWNQGSFSDAGRSSKLLMLRMGADFAVEKKPMVVYEGDVGGTGNNAGSVELACGDGHCLAVWRDRGVAAVDPIRALRVVDGKPVGLPFDIATTTGIFEPKVASSGDAYLVLVGDRTAHPCGPTNGSICTKAILGVRLNGSGEPLDPLPRELITAPADTGVGIRIDQIGFDGEQYVLPYTLTNDCSRRCDSSVFVTRVAVDGTVLDQDAPRTALLVDPTRDRQEVAPVAAVTADGVTVVWHGWPRDPVAGIATSLSLEARSLDTHSTDMLPALVLGSIGSVTLDEGERWAVRLVAPGLPSARFSAEGLPADAVLDASSGVLHWTPAPHEAGSYAGLRLMADDGPQHIEETILITVSNTVSSLSGIVREADGTPVPRVAVSMVGRYFKKRETVTETDGRYAFFGVRPQSYRLGLGRAARKSWRALPVRLSIAGATDDVAGVDLTVTPR